jgi:hypothetical protein
MCFWAVESKQDGAFVGAVGLLPSLRPREVAQYRGKRS